MPDSRPFKLRVTLDAGYRTFAQTTPYATAKARQAAMDRLRLMHPDLREQLSKIETWEASEPLITEHDPADYREGDE